MDARGDKITGGENLLVNPEIQVKNFNELTNLQVLNALALRYNVFVREQQSIFNEYDGHDTSAKHLFIEDGGQIIAYARIYRESEDAVAIGRVAVAKEYRRQGLAKQIVKQAIITAGGIAGIDTINIAAQTYLRPFYESFGFAPTSEPYDDDGVMHLNMTLSLKVGPSPTAI